MIEIETENEEVVIERENEIVIDPNQTTLEAFKRPIVVTTTNNKGRPKGARDLQPREPSHCSTCGAVHRKASMRRAGADGRPHCIECDPAVVRWV